MARFCESGFLTALTVGGWVAASSFQGDHVLHEGIHLLCPLVEGCILSIHSAIEKTS
jgi:hypothetical protein